MLLCTFMCKVLCRYIFSFLLKWNIPRSGITGSYSNSVFIHLWNCQMFPKWLKHFTFPTTVLKALISSSLTFWSAQICWCHYLSWRWIISCKSYFTNLNGSYLRWWSICSVFILANISWLTTVCQELLSAKPVNMKKLWLVGEAQTITSANFWETGAVMTACSRNSLCF